MTHLAGLQLFHHNHSVRFSICCNTEILTCPEQVDWIDWDTPPPPTHLVGVVIVDFIIFSICISKCLSNNCPLPFPLPCRRLESLGIWSLSTTTTTATVHQLGPRQCINFGHSTADPTASLPCALPPRLLCPPFELASRAAHISLACQHLCSSDHVFDTSAGGRPGRVGWVGRGGQRCPTACRNPGN